MMSLRITRTPGTIALCIALPLLIILALFVSTFLWGVYYKHWDNGFITAVTNVLPLPAGKIGKTVVLYRDYRYAVDSVEVYLQSDQAAEQNMRRPLTDEDRKNVLERLLREIALEDLARVRNVTITDDQITAAMEAFNTSGSSTKDINDFLIKNFGWSVEDFQKHIVRPLLLTRTMGASYAVDHGNDPNALDVYLDNRLKQQDVVRYVKF
jgi:hypothetical protein